MGGIKDHNLHFENADDQYLGTVVSSLDYNGYLFAVSLLYFDHSIVANEED